MLLQNAVVAPAGGGRILGLVYFADIAQLVERIHGKDEVRGSIPRVGSVFVGYFLISEKPL